MGTDLFPPPAPTPLLAIILSLLSRNCPARLLPRLTPDRTLTRSLPPLTPDATLASEPSEEEEEEETTETPPPPYPPPLDSVIGANVRREREDAAAEVEER